MNKKKTKQRCTTFAQKTCKNTAVKQINNQEK